MVGVRVGAHDLADVAATPVGVRGSLPQALHMVGVGRTGVDHGKAARGVAHQVAIGSGAGHDARVGRGQAQHVAQQGYRLQAVPGRGLGQGGCVGVEELRGADHGGHFATKWAWPR